MSVVECLEKISAEVQRVAMYDRFPPHHPLAIELGDCVTAYVRAVEKLGTQPEAAIVLLKRIIQDHLRVNEYVRRSLNEDVIRWVITAYYGAPAKPK